MYQAIHHSLEKGVAREDLQGPLEGTNLPGDACLVLTTDPKPRLRWTAELHERFVDAVTQLGGPDSKFRSPLLLCLDSGKMSLAFVFFGVSFCCCLAVVSFCSLKIARDLYCFPSNAALCERSCFLVRDTKNGAYVHVVFFPLSFALKVGRAS